MDLSVRETATLLGVTRRTVRARLARGELPGRKRAGRWRVPRHGLPLDAAQRRAVQAKAASLRETVDAVLPSRLGGRSRSLADLDAFRRGVRLLADLRRGDDEESAVRSRAAGLLERALLALAEAVQLFDRELKLAALNRARTRVARATALLLLDAGVPPAEPVRGWVVALEHELAPALAGLARWADGLGRRRR